MFTVTLSSEVYGDQSFNYPNATEQEAGFKLELNHIPRTMELFAPSLKDNQCLPTLHL